jgi:hypothetical protein
MQLSLRLQHLWSLKQRWRMLPCQMQARLLRTPLLSQPLLRQRTRHRQAQMPPRQLLTWRCRAAL